MWSGISLSLADQVVQCVTETRYSGHYVEQGASFLQNRKTYFAYRLII